MRHANDCERVREGLREYLDLAGPPGDGHALRRHLTGCQACQSALDEPDDTARLLAELPRPTMPAGMKATLLAAFRRAS
jgi:anti-sigma factor RsiW